MELDFFRVLWKYESGRTDVHIHHERPRYATPLMQCVNRFSLSILPQHWNNLVQFLYKYNFSRKVNLRKYESTKICMRTYYAYMKKIKCER